MQPEKKLLNFKLTPEEDLLLALLQKELLIHTCLCDWEDFGMDTSGWPIDLGAIILSAFGFTKMDDDLLTWFYTTLNTYSIKLKHEESTASELTLQLYTALKQKISPFGREREGDSDE